MSDKQKALPSAIAHVFEGVAHAFCQSHYLKNLAEPIAAVDQQLKVTMLVLRKQVGELIRQEEVESPGVLTVTGLIPSPIEDEADMMRTKQAECDIKIENSEQLATTSQIECHIQTETSGSAATFCQVENCCTDSMVNWPISIEVPNSTNHTPHPIAADLWRQVGSDQQTLRAIEVTVESDYQDQAQSDVQAGTSVYEFEVESQSSKSVQQERDDIIVDLTRRVRYLLTLKGRPPFLLAGLEMFTRLGEVVNCIEAMILHEADNRLVKLCEGIKVGINEVCDQMQELSVAAGWLREISDLLDPEGKESRTAEEVNQELSNYLRNLRTGQLSSSLDQIANQLQNTTNNYSAGLFVSYDVQGLPRTNNERESEFRLPLVYSEQQARKEQQYV